MKAKIINESIKSKLKPIQDVETGDIAFDYNNNKLEVVASGVGRGNFNAYGINYDESGIMDSYFDEVQNYPEDYPDLNTDTIEWIACFSEYDSESAVFNYGYDGAYVEVDEFVQNGDPYRTLGIGKHFKKINESATSQTLMNIRHELSSFLTGVVIPQSKGHVNNERNAALHLYDVLKERYKIGN